jgi:hypothetical protein
MRYEQTRGVVISEEEHVENEIPDDSQAMKDLVLLALSPA